MNLAMTMDDTKRAPIEMPGAFLKQQREALGLTQEYIATKLHLRVRVIELLETDDYQNMPEAVFVKGYFRAYAKLLDLAPEPLLQTYNDMFPPQHTSEKALWQGRREKHKSVRAMRWVTGLFVIAAVATVGLWWGKYQDTHPVMSHSEEISSETSSIQALEIHPEDVHKLNKLLSLESKVLLTEKPGV